MTGTLTATTVDVRLDAPPGATRILLQNLAAATATLTFHQGFAPGVGDAAANQLSPGESVMLSGARPVYVNSVAQAAGSFTYGFLA